MKCNKKCGGIITAVILTTACVAVVLVLVLVVFDLSKGPAPQAATTTGGVIVGRTVTLEDGKTQIHEFHNIRYAEAPVGELRFRPPKPHVVANSSEVVQATDDTAIICIQARTGEGSEDCLFLTVRSANLTTSKPVVVWIHGGGLATRYGTEIGYSFDSEVTKNVDAVTVNINYRLGFIGFSSVKELWDEDAGVYANNGIRDMIAALDWIQDNIAAFGGDPNSVTLIGNSGGATAILALMCSPLAKNKFHAGIAQSPAPEMRFTHEDGDAYQRTIVEQAGCSTQDTLAQRKQCLLDYPANKFAKKYIKIDAGDAYYFFPRMFTEAAEVVGLIVIDPIVVTKSARNLKDVTFAPASPLPLIISNTAEESYFYTLMLLAAKRLAPETANETMKVLFKNLTDEENMLDTAYAMYPGVTDAMSLWNLITVDMRATCPINDVATAMALSTNHRIYRLYITHRSSSGFPAVHSYDSAALFGYKKLDMPWLAPFNAADVKFQMHYIDMVKQLITDKTAGWGTFPSKSMVFENSDDISNVGSDKPQQSVCEKLEELDLVKFGWQNK